MLKFDLNPEHTKICPSCQKRVARFNKVSPLIEGAFNKIATESKLVLEDRMAILYAMLGRHVGQATNENRDVVKLQLTLGPIMGANADEECGEKGNFSMEPFHSLPHVHD